MSSANTTEALTVARLVLTSVIVLPNFVGNVLVCLVVLRHKSLRTLINFLLVHLAIADILAGVFVILQAVFDYATLQGKSSIIIHFCKLVYNQHVVFMAVVSSYTTIIMVSVLRYLGITRPLQSREIMRVGKLFYFVPIIWLISIVSLAPRIYADFSVPGCTRIVAISKTSRISGGISIVVRGIMIPVVTLAYTYRKICHALQKRFDGLPMTTHQIGTMKSARLLGFVIIAFILFTVPYHAFGFIVSILEFHEFSSNVFLEMVLFCVYMSGSSVNPYLYWFHCRRFRRMTYKMLSRQRKVHPVQNLP